MRIDERGRNQNNRFWFECSVVARKRVREFLRNKFSQASSPACTELESIVMNWLGKMIGLPDEFLHIPGVSKGGGVIQTTASEATLVCLLAGRTQAIRRFHEHTPGKQDAEINARLVAYCSDQAHSSVEKAALIGLVRMRFIESDENLSLTGRALEEAIEEDMQQGLIPFWVCATLGTTGACAFDNLLDVGDVCRKYRIWMHVDAAYAGSAFICPEFRVWLKGIEKADSIAFNPSKWLMVHFDCTAMWVKNSGALHRTFNVEPLYLQHENSGLAIDYMHWQIPLSKRFRALKLWFVLRNFGIKGLQKHIREGVRLAQKFEALVLADHRFEIPAARHLGMVVFRIRGENELTEKLLKRLNHRGNMHAVPASLKGKYVIRFTVTSTYTTSDDILKDWSEIKTVTSDLLQELDVKIVDRSRVPLKETREKNEAFGSSLLLANSPMSPKIVNGSFAAIFDADEFLAKVYAGIRISNQDSPAMRRRVRGILMSGKQFSLDSRMDLVVQGISPSEVKNGIESKAITEDCEEAWEVCEQIAVADQDNPFESLDSQFLLPIPLHCPTPPSSPRRHLRSASVDVGMIHVQTSSNALFRLFDKPNPFGASSRSEPYYSIGGSFASSPQSLPGEPGSGLGSTESNLDSMEETVRLGRYLQGSKRRYSDSGQLFPFSKPNAPPEKRQSEPTIRYAFYNKSFDLICPRQPKRVLSYNDIGKRSFRRQISTIDELIADEAILDGASDENWKKLNLIAPKFRCCISDEDGRCINFDPVYHNHETELNEEQLMRNVLAFEENFVARFEQVCPQLERKESAGVLSSIEEQVSAEEMTGSSSCGEMSDDSRKNSRKSFCDDEVIYENVKVCRKCGHQTVRLL
ncbi:histidine decarboxylase-like [Uranotaenia lowii]|uniref:histidine decarboxylase-like n=1 Tax=Uranotaenia lowii TaxID=190385 RepID=UPI0024784D01|nr:histidine decarboxylase-like [Uranotaenia lowii]